MDTELVDEIVGKYKIMIGERRWGNTAVRSLRDVLYSLDKPPIDKQTKQIVPVDDSPIDFLTLKMYIEGRSIDGIFDKLKLRLNEKNIHTHSELVAFVEERKEKSLNQNGVRDIFCFRATGSGGIKALYTYMHEVLHYCPFENGYAPKELNV